MYLPSVIGLLFLFLHYVDAEPCNGYCVPKHRCLSSGVEGEKTLGNKDFITLLVDEESECGDFMKTCCERSSVVPTPAVETLLKADHNACGISNHQGLVYDVTSKLTYAKYAEFPWTVAILRTSFPLRTFYLSHVGDGTLIHPKFVVTVAHIWKKPHRYVARFGEWNMLSDAEIYPTQDIEILDQILHPSYEYRYPSNNDIALAVLKQSVIYTAHIRPLCLPSPQDVFDGQQCIASGWGMDLRTQWPAGIMKRIKLNVLSRERCELLHKWGQKLDINIQVPHRGICVEAVDPQTTCAKESGIPLACPREDGSYVLAGINSWELFCGKPEESEVYVNVAKFTRWINNTIEGYEELHSEE